MHYIAPKKIRELSYEDMIELRKQGITLREIGERLGGISRERVRQLIGNTKDITPKKIILTKEERKEIRDQKRIDRFWGRVDRRGTDDCWNWTANCHPVTGYGRTRCSRDFIYSHRMAYELTHGEIPVGMCVLHSCDNPKCCNPAHLRVGTQQDNVDDRVARNNKKKSGSKSYYETRNLEIYKSYTGEMKEISCIANKYGISGQMVYTIIRRYQKQQEARPITG
jgi:hypothetical protein